MLKFKSFEQMHSEVIAQIKAQRERDGGKITIEERLECRTQLSAIAAVTAIKLGAAVAVLLAIDARYPGAWQAYATLVTVCAIGAVVIDNAVDKARLTLDSVKSGAWLTEQLLERRVKAQETLRVLEHRADCPAGIESKTLTPAQSMRILAVELEKAQAQGRHRDAAALNSQIQLLTHGVKGEATEAHIKKQEQADTAQEDTKH